MRVILSTLFLLALVAPFSLAQSSSKLSSILASSVSSVATSDSTSSPPKVASSATVGLSSVLMSSGAGSKVGSSAVGSSNVVISSSPVSSSSSSAPVASSLRATLLCNAHPAFGTGIESAAYLQWTNSSNQLQSSPAVRYGQCVTIYGVLPQPITQHANDTVTWNIVSGVNDTMLYQYSDKYNFNVDLIVLRPRLVNGSYDLSLWSLTPIGASSAPLQPGYSRLLFGNFIYNSPAGSLTVNGQTVISSLPYRTVNYFDVPAGLSVGNTTALFNVVGTAMNVNGTAANLLWNGTLPVSFAAGNMAVALLIGEYKMVDNNAAVSSSSMVSSSMVSSSASSSSAFVPVMNAPIQLLLTPSIAPNMTFGMQSSSSSSATSYDAVLFCNFNTASPVDGVYAVIGEVKSSITMYGKCNVVEGIPNTGKVNVQLQGTDGKTLATVSYTLQGPPLDILTAYSDNSNNWAFSTPGNPAGQPVNEGYARLSFGNYLLNNNSNTMNGLNGAYITIDNTTLGALNFTQYSSYDGPVAQAPKDWDIVINDLSMQKNMIASTHANFTLKDQSNTLIAVIGQQGSTQFPPTVFIYPNFQPGYFIPGSGSNSTTILSSTGVASGNSTDNNGSWSGSFGTGVSKADSSSASAKHVGMGGLAIALLASLMLL